MSTATATTSRPTAASPDVFGDDHKLASFQLLVALHAQCRDLMNQHGLDGWELTYGAGRTGRLGFTRHDVKRITLSAPLMVAVTGAERLDVIRHEMAHALCPKDEKHGEVWKEVARRLGATPRSHLDLDEDADRGRDLPVVGRCPFGHEFPRATMPAPHRLNAYHCTHPSHRGIPVAQRKIVFSRRRPEPIDPGVEAAVRKFGPTRTIAESAPAPAMSHKVGDRVLVHGTGSARWDGRVGTVVKVSKVNYVVKIVGEPRNLRIRGNYVKAY